MNENEKNKIREKIQNEIADLSLKYNNLIIECGTGFGKALAVIKCIDKSKSKKKWLIIVPEIIQQDNFKKEFEKFGYTDLFKNKIEAIICYDSLHKYTNTLLNLALNECQNVTDNVLEHLKTIKADQIIPDSATISYKIRQRLQELGDFHTYYLPLQEGIKLGILPKPKIYTIPVNLNSVKKKFLYTAFKKEKIGSAEEYYNHLCNQIIYWKKRSEVSNELFAKNIFLSNTLKRKKLLGEIKTEKAKEIINQFEKNNKRYIVFSSSIEQAETLGTKKFTINYKKKKENQGLIDKFNNYEINKLFPVSMLISGMNLTHLNSALVVQLDSGYDTEQAKIIQQLGRILRDDSPEMYILYVPETKDEDYLKWTIKAIGEEFIIKN